MAKIFAPTSGSQWVSKNKLEDKNDYNSLGLGSERAVGVVLHHQEVRLLKKDPTLTFKPFLRGA